MGIYMRLMKRLHSEGDSSALSERQGQRQGDPSDASTQQIKS